MDEQSNQASSSEIDPLATGPEASPAQKGSAKAATGAPSEGSAEAPNSTVTSGPSALSAQDELIYTIRLLTAVSVGAVVEGGDQLVSRLKRYEMALQESQVGDGENGPAAIDEDEFDRLRYAVIGLIFDTQNMIGRSIALSAQATELALDVTNELTKPMRNFFLFRPVTKRVEKRFDQMAQRGRGNLARWTEIGRQVEPEGRRLAEMTYRELVDEFISKLADNPELQQLVAQQSISLAAGVRDEVRERTVTSDNVLEGIARRILRRTPRPELAEPPPAVMRWAGISVDELRHLEEGDQDEQRADSAE
jgi:hypothetical protein